MLAICHVFIVSVSFLQAKELSALALFYIVRAILTITKLIVSFNLNELMHRFHSSINGPFLDT